MGELGSLVALVDVKKEKKRKRQTADDVSLVDHSGVYI